jgi:uncharacterized protein YkwD
LIAFYGLVLSLFNEMNSLMVKRVLIVAFSLAILIVSCQKEDVTPGAATNSDTGSTPPVTGSAIVFNVDKTKLLQLVNNTRQAGCNCGTTKMPPVSPVTWNDKLAKAAYEHSVEMNANDYFSHTGLNGSTPGQRITGAGYVWKAYGENIAKGYSSEQAVMNGWLASEGHCKNIMSAAFKEMGAGKQGVYWTQDFGAK